MTTQSYVNKYSIGWVGIVVLIQENLIDMDASHPDSSLLWATWLIILSKIKWDNIYFQKLMA